MRAFLVGCGIGIIIFSIVVLFGCGTTHYIDKTETIIKHDTIFVQPPIIKDTISDNNLVIDDSGNVFGSKVEGQDTVIKVVYYPKEKRITVEAKPETLLIPITDTVTVSHTTIVTKEPGWLETNGIWIIIIIVGLVILLVVIKKVVL